MPRYSFPTASGGPAVDVSMCTPFHKESKTKTLAASNTYESLLSVTGKGFLDYLYFQAYNVDATVKMKVTIDGVLVWGGNSESGSTALAGFVNEEILNAGKLRDPTLPTSCSQPLRNVYREWPDTSDNQPGFNYISSALFFKTSLLIEVSTTDKTKAIAYAYSGGSY